MKTIIFLLLTSVIWGQELDISSDLFNDIDETIMYSTWVISDGGRISLFLTDKQSNVFVPDSLYFGKRIDGAEDYFTFAFLLLYDQYDKECYADSSLDCFQEYWLIQSDNYEETYRVPCSSLDFDLGINSNYKGQVEMWTHREPTFKGFIKYLRTKQDK